MIDLEETEGTVRYACVDESGNNWQEYSGYANNIHVRYPENCESNAKNFASTSVELGLPKAVLTITPADCSLQYNDAGDYSEYVLTTKYLLKIKGITFTTPSQTGDIAGDPGRISFANLTKV